MKSKQEIRKRLEKLRSRYLQEYVQDNLGRKPKNCTYNEVHLPRPLTYRHEPEEFERAPRISNSLVIIGPENGVPVRLCMYRFEADSNGEAVAPVWNGDVCDRDEIAQHCKFFEPKIGLTTKQIEESFNNLLTDDAYVLKNYPDLAALQWVLDERIHKQKLDFFNRLLYIITVFFIKKRPLPALQYSGAAKPEDEAPEEYWDG